MEVREMLSRMADGHVIEITMENDQRDVLAGDIIDGKWALRRYVKGRWVDTSSMMISKQAMYRDLTKFPRWRTAPGFCRPAEVGPDVWTDSDGVGWEFKPARLPEGSIHYEVEMEPGDWQHLSGLKDCANYGGPVVKTRAGNHRLVSHYPCRLYCNTHAPALDLSALNVGSTYAPPLAGVLVKVPE